MKPYLKIFKTELVQMKEYISMFISSVIYVPISMMIYYFLFKYILKDGNLSMSLEEILVYYAVVLVIKTSLSHSMAEVYYVFNDINEGDLDLFLVRPVSLSFHEIF